MSDDEGFVSATDSNYESERSSDAPALALTVLKDKETNQTSFPLVIHPLNPIESPEYVDFSTPSTMERLGRAMEIVLRCWKSRKDLESGREAIAVDLISLEFELQSTPSSSPFEGSFVEQIASESTSLLLLHLANPSDSPLALSAASLALDAVSWNLPVFSVFDSEFLSGIEAHPSRLTTWTNESSSDLKYLSQVVELFSARLGPRRKMRSSVQLKFQSPDYKAEANTEFSLRLKTQWLDRKETELIDTPSLSELDPPNTERTFLKVKVKKLSGEQKFPGFLTQIYDWVEKGRTVTIGYEDGFERGGIDPVEFFQSRPDLHLNLPIGAMRGASDPRNPFSIFTSALLFDRSPDLGRISAEWHRFVRFIRKRAETAMHLRQEDRSKTPPLFLPYVVQSIDLSQSLIAQKLESIELCLKNLEISADRAWMTEDIIKTEQAILAALEPEDRIHYWSGFLHEEMVNFKQKTPAVSFEGFLEFFCPRDVNATGSISSRFDRKTGGGSEWRKVWDLAVPGTQSPRGKHTEFSVEIEKALDYLECCDTVLEQMWWTGFGIQVSRLISSDPANLAACGLPKAQQLGRLVECLESQTDQSTTALPRFVFFPTSLELQTLADSLAELQRLVIIGKKLSMMMGGCLLSRVIPALVNSGKYVEIGNSEDRLLDDGDIRLIKELISGSHSKWKRKPKSKICIVKVGEVNMIYAKIKWREGKSVSNLVFRKAHESCVEY